MRALKLGLFRPLLMSSAIGLGVEPAMAQTPTPAAVQTFVRNTTRAEMWRYFEPPPPTPALAARKRTRGRS